MRAGSWELGVGNCELGVWLWKLGVELFELGIASCELGVESCTGSLKYFIYLGFWSRELNPGRYEQIRLYV